MDIVLIVKGLTKTYGDIAAVSDVSFSVGRTDIVGLVGPNGAGKTSTISMILGVLVPSAGTVHVLGHNVATQRVAAIRNVNFAAVYAQLPGNLTVGENLTFFGHLYDVENLTTRLQEVLEMLDIKKFEHTKLGVLSSGEQTRVGLAKAFLSKPALLLLDEPTASMDPATARDIRKLIVAYANSGNAVLWTSHNMQEVEDVCTKVIFLSHGRILLQGNPHTLPGEHGKANLEELFISAAREPLSLDI